MPTIFDLLGFKFFFYANDHEPIHVHVKKGDGKAIFQVVPEIKLLKSKNMKPKELVVAEGIVEDRKDEIITAWDTFFNTQK